MKSTAVYVEGKGIVLTLQGASEGLSFTVPDNMLVSALEKHLTELEDFLS